MAFSIRTWRHHIFISLVSLCVCALLFFAMNIRGSKLDRRHESEFAARMVKCAAANNCHTKSHRKCQAPGSQSAGLCVFRTEPSEAALHWLPEIECTDEETIMRNVSDACPDAHRHGPHQKVISFAFYGNWKPWRKFLEGVSRNAELAARLYPDWRIRIYHNMPEGHRWDVVLRHAACCHENIDLCPLTPPIGKMNMLWRILPMADPFVDVFVSRDLDSRLSQREVDAVSEWLADDSKPFHLMRDHHYHTALVMGGMWGCKVRAMRPQLTALVQRILTYQRQDLVDDQEVLSYYMVPLLQNRVMQHDSFYCTNFTFLGGMRPFPSKREFGQPNFVGGVYFDEILDECPPQCRPSDKQHWIYC